MKPFVPVQFGGAIEEWCRKLAEALRAVIDGRVEWSLDVTLTPSSTTTAITDPRIRPTSALVMTPVTATAGASSTWAVAGDGTATITHTSDAATDRSFRVLVIG